MVARAAAPIKVWPVAALINRRLHVSSKAVTTLREDSASVLQTVENNDFKIAFLKTIFV